jgi:hypothetical protein
MISITDFWRYLPIIFRNESNKFIRSKKQVIHKVVHNLVTEENKRKKVIGYFFQKQVIHTAVCNLHKKEKENKQNLFQKGNKLRTTTYAKWIKNLINHFGVLSPKHWY